MSSEHSLKKVGLRKTRYGSEPISIAGYKAKCQAGLCQPVEFDYLVCSGGALGLGRTEVINLHNGKSYGSATINPKNANTTVQKTSSILKDVFSPKINNNYKLKNKGLADVKSLANTLGASCNGGHIMNKVRGVESSVNTDNFIKGLSVTVSGGQLIKLGATFPVTKEWIHKKQMVGLEVGLGLGKGVDVEFTEGASSVPLKDLLLRD